MPLQVLNLTLQQTQAWIAERVASVSYLAGLASLNRSVYLSLAMVAYNTKA
jgi:hypothetical protein